MTELGVTISNGAPKGKLCFEDASNSLLNEEMHMKSMGEVMPNMEALTLGDRGRKPYREKSKDEVLITVSYEDACLYTSSHDSDWILDSGAPTMLPQIKIILFLIEFAWVIKAFIH